VNAPCTTTLISRKVWRVQPRCLRKNCGVHGEIKHFHNFFFSLIFYEVYISHGLVFNRRTRELVGYINLDAVQTAMVDLEKEIYEDLDDVPPLATKMLTYMIKSLTSSAKFVVASYTVHTLLADDLFSKTWDTVGQLEKIGAKILVFVGDGSMVNSKFFDKQKDLSNDGVVYKTVNLRSPELRNVYFISDLSHLGKTVRTGCGR